MANANNKKKNNKQWIENLFSAQNLNVQQGMDGYYPEIQKKIRKTLKLMDKKKLYVNYLPNNLTKTEKGLTTMIMGYVFPMGFSIVKRKKKTSSFPYRLWTTKNKENQWACEWTNQKVQNKCMTEMITDGDSSDFLFIMSHIGVAYHQTNGMGYKQHLLSFIFKSTQFPS